MVVQGLLASLILEVFVVVAQIFVVVVDFVSQVVRHIGVRVGLIAVGKVPGSGEVTLYAGEWTDHGSRRRAFGVGNSTVAKLGTSR